MLKKSVIYVLIIAMMLCWLPSIAVPVSAATGYDRGYDGGMAGDGKIYAHGIDVSSWQGSSLDFQNIKNAGYSYVILRVGTSYGKDECFETFYTKAKAAGLNVGAYYYSYATTTSAAYTDASNVLSWLSGKKFEYPIYFDYEDSSQSGISGQTSSEICYAFMDTLKNAGYLVGMYSMASWIEQSWVTTYGIRDTYEGWVAHYPTFDSNTGITSNVYNTYNSTYNTKYGMYQYSSTTYVNGAGPFDANIAYKDYPSIVSKYGFNGYTANSSSSSTTQSYKLTCSSYISNATARNYIDKMMNYYINNYSTLKSTLAAGQAVVFMFEGGSDNYWTGSDYVNSVWDVRIQAVAIVVKQDSNGDPYIAFCSEDCSSIPSYAPNCTAGVGYSGSVTILDGIYRMYRWDHTGPYAAFQLDIPNSNANGYGLYVPDSVPDGQLLGCSGINVHTRSTTSGSYWSEGCQLIGTGNDSSNAFNAFFRAVTGINATPWISWSPKSLYTWNGLGYYYGSSYTVGYFVVDRQLGMLGMDGTKYGTGSLNSIYNTTALGKLTSFSTSAAQAAGALNFDYVSTNCTYYPAHCKITVTRDQAPVNSEPCSIGTTTSNKTVEYAPAGTTYTATGLFKNGYGNYWYRVISNTGETAYIYGGEAYYVEELTSDITISGYSAPNGHVAGSYFYLTGNITSEYNQLNSASVYVHSGFGTSGSKMTGASASISGNSFNLSGSAIDSDTEFDKISTGQYTYAVSVNYTNYYAEGATTLKENTKTIYLRQDYFMVIPSSVSQSSCSHSYTTTNMGSGNCLNSLTIVKSCSTCGHITTTASSGAHTFSDWTTVNATCTSAGYKSRTCSVCGTQEKETYAALGHNYTKKVIEATCVSHMRYEYTCSNCGDTYVQDTGSLSGQWLESIPEGMDASLFNTKTQYRYSDLETTTSTSSSLSGYTQTGSSWVQTGTGSVQYVANWSSGFYTLSSLYAQYNKKSSKVTAYENETTKRIINSDAITGYLYFHWCTYGSYYSYEYPSSTYNLFDAYYSTTSPWNYDCDYNDMSYNTKVTTCSNSTWYFVDEVYTQKYTDYTKQYTYQRWGDYGAWSDTAVSASSTRQVQTRTLYQLKATNLGDHSWNSGSITTAAGCTTAGVKTYSCNLCGTTKTESVPALGHSYNAVVTAPTCTAAGYTTCTCANCGDSYVTDQVAANGHNWANATCTTAKTCSVCGTAEGDALGHNYSAVVTAPTCTTNGYTTYTCATCGDTYVADEVAATGHSFSDATCTDAPVCGICGTVEGNALGHNWTEATCTTAKTCGVCGAVKGEALGHDYQATVTSAGCTTQGYTTHTCSHCGDSYVDSYVDATGHAWDSKFGYCEKCGIDCIHEWDDGVITREPSCTNTGKITYTCTVCGGTKANTLPNTGHSFVMYHVGATCTDQSCTVYQCENCDTNYSVPYGEPLGHDHIGSVTQEATCTENGVMTYCCSRCADSYTESIAALGHSYNAAVTAPDCVNGGYTTYTCATCGDSYVSDEVGANGHNYEAVVTAPTCTTAGYTTYTCDGCGDSYVADRVSSLGHSFSDATCTDAPVCVICGATEGEALGHSYNAVVTAPTCGAAGYTTYTCSVCGDSYVADEVAATGAHSYGYSFVNGCHTLTCSGCNDVISVAGTNELKFRNATLSLASDISVIFKLDIDDVFEVGYMVFEVNGEETYVYDYTIDESNGRRVFAYQGINPQMMGDSINCTMHVYLDGTEVTVSYAGYSVVKYCNSQFNKTDATVKQVCANLLNYGAAVQLKKGYKTDALVNASLPVDPETFPGVGAITNQQAMSGTANNVSDIKSVALQLSNKVEIKVGMVLDNPADYEIKVTIKGNEYIYGVDDLQEDGGRYYLYFSNLNARDFDETITFVILKDGVEVSRTLTYSVNSYIARNGGADTADGNTLRALYCYGKSTESL